MFELRVAARPVCRREQRRKRHALVAGLRMKPGRIDRRGVRADVRIGMHLCAGLPDEQSKRQSDAPADFAIEPFQD